MFPHTITVYHLVQTKNSDKYEMLVIPNVYVQKKKGKTQNKTHIEAQNELIVTLSQTASRTLTGSFFAGDKLVVGQGNKIASIKELSDYYTITSVSENVFGCSVDNIVIEAK